MNGCFTMGGSAAVKIKAIAVASADQLPDNVKDGRIAIISTVTPGAVYVQNTEPANPENGDVWMMTTEASVSPITLKTITLYPSQFFQYVDGAWVAVAGYVRYLGAWVAPVLWLYSNGNQYYSVTGGWDGVTDGGRYSADGAHGGEKCISLAAPTSATGGQTRAAVFSANKIPAGVYSKMHITFYRDDDNGIVKFGFSDIKSAKEPGKVLYTVTGRDEGGVYRTATIDMSQLDADYSGYLCLYVGSPTNGDTEYVYVREIYLTN